MYRKANIVFYVKRFPHFTCNRSSWTLSSSPMLPLMKPNICFSPLCLQDRINWVFVVYHKIIGCNIWRIENIIRNVIYMCANTHSMPTIRLYSIQWSAKPTPGMLGECRPFKLHQRRGHCSVCSFLYFLQSLCAQIKPRKNLLFNALLLSYLSRIFYAKWNLLLYLFLLLLNCTKLLSCLFSTVMSYGYACRLVNWKTV